MNPPFNSTTTSQTQLSPDLSIDFSPNDIPSSNSHIGQSPPDIKPSNTFRIYYTNPNGFTYSNSTENDLTEHYNEILRLDTDLFCAAEINLDTTKHSVKHHLHSTTKHVFDHSWLTYSSTTIPSVNTYKPGGTLSLIQGSSTGRVISAGSDVMGQWSYHILAGKDSKRICFITLYFPSEQRLHTSDGRLRTLTVQAQQTSILQQQGRNITPQTAFYQDLNFFLQSLRDTGHSLLLVGDFNQSLTSSNTQLLNLCHSYDLVDLMANHLDTTTFNTHISGQERIDFVLCDPWISQTLTSGCYEPFKFRTKGDHRNILLDFNVHELFGNPTYRLHTNATRDFTTKCTSSVIQYVSAKFKYLQEHNFASRLHEVENNWNPSAIEQLDQDFQRSGIHASHLNKKKPNVAYVKSLAELHKQKNILRRILSSYKHGISLTTAIAHHTINGYQYPIPSTHALCQKECRRLQRMIKNKSKNASIHRKQQQEHSLSLAQA